MQWIVIPEDPYLPPQEFSSLNAAEEWAAGLCCSYIIQRG